MGSSLAGGTGAREPAVIEQAEPARGWSQGIRCRWGLGWEGQRGGCCSLWVQVSLSSIVLQSPSCHPHSTKEETEAQAGRRMDWPRASQRVNLGLQTSQPHAALTLTPGLLGGGHVDSLTVPGSETKQEPQPASVLLEAVKASPGGEGASTPIAQTRDRTPF